MSSLELPTGLWILPASLHTSACALDTQALTLGFAESSRLCAPLLTVRSKVLPSRTWSQKWKRDSWTLHLFGRILKPSLGNSFSAAYASSLAVIPASPLAPPACDSDTRTPDIFGHTSSPGSKYACPTCVSLKTSKGIFPLDCATCSKIWKTQVTELRLDYSARLRSALLTSASESSSWPTASARDWKDSPGMATEAVDKDGSRQLVCPTAARAVFVHCGPAAPVPHSTPGNPLELWATPAAAQADQGQNEADGKRSQTLIGQARGQVWMTPNVPNGGRSPAIPMSMTGKKADGTKGQVGLENQVRWATPRADEHGQKNSQDNHMAVSAQVKQTWPTPNTAPTAPNSGLNRGKNHGGIRPRNKSQCLGDMAKWGTPRVTTNGGHPSPQCTGKGSRLEDQVSEGKTQKWATPRAEMDSSPRKLSDTVAQSDLNSQVKTWPTPRALSGGPESSERKKELGRTESGGSDLQAAAAGTLNPRWVETLMGIPVGWTMPGCARPVTIVSTSFDFVETESCPTPPNELSACSGESLPEES
jgi:hypothetical protein